jgi:hypothetical protein
MTDDRPGWPCSRCHATDQQVACVRYGARNHRSTFEFKCIDQSACDFRKAALPEPTKRTVAEIRAELNAVRAARQVAR